MVGAVRAWGRRLVRWMLLSRRTRDRRLLRPLLPDPVATIHRRCALLPNPPEAGFSNPRPVGVPSLEHQHLRWPAVRCQRRAGQAGQPIPRRRRPLLLRAGRAGQPIPRRQRRAGRVGRIPRRHRHHLLRAGRAGRPIPCRLPRACPVALIHRPLALALNFQPGFILRPARLLAAGPILPSRLHPACRQAACIQGSNRSLVGLVIRARFPHRWRKGQAG